MFSNVKQGDTVYTNSCIRRDKIVTGYALHKWEVINVTAHYFKMVSEHSVVEYNEMQNMIVRVRKKDGAVQYNRASSYVPDVAKVLPLGTEYTDVELKTGRLSWKRLTTYTKLSTQLMCKYGCNPVAKYLDKHIPNALTYNVMLVNSVLRKFQKEHD